MHYMDKHKKLCIGIVILVCIGIPAFINIVMSLNLIPSIDTGNAEWLGFWGSFLGGIVGGIATLIGIVYTMKTFFYDKKPVLIPLKKEFYIYINNEKKVELASNLIIESEEVSIKPIEFDIINVGRGAALDVEIRWMPPKQVVTGDEKKDKFIDDNNKNTLIDLTNKEEEFQVIRCDDGTNVEKINIFIGLEELIKLIVKAHVSGKVVILGMLNFIFDVSLGYIEIYYNDIYHSNNKKQLAKYEMFLKTQGISYNKNIETKIYFKGVKID